ncbi:MAG: type II CAAX endopeptidase family protein [Rhizomicrobium sp.]
MAEDSQDKRGAWRRIGAFVVLVAILTALSTYVLVHTQLPGRLKFTIVMWVPGLSAIAVKLAFDRSLNGLGFVRSGGRWLFVALLLPLAYALPVYLAVWLTGMGGFAPERWGAAVPYLVAPTSTGLAVALLLTVGLLDKFSRALGEEIGWRGFLVPEFLKLMPLAPAGLITGAIWAVWHVPAILFGGYNAGSIPLGYQLACFFVMVISSGVFFAWIRQRSNSVWPPALLHAAHNLFIQSFFDQATVNGPKTLYVTGEFGAGLALTACATAVAVLMTRKDRTAAAAAG